MKNKQKQTKHLKQSEHFFKKIKETFLKMNEMPKQNVGNEQIF